MARNTRDPSKRDHNKRKPVEVKGRARRGRPKVCLFCAEHVEWVDYKDTAVLRRFMNDRGRIKARGATGTCAQHQRDVAVAVKTARELVLLPYVVRMLAADKGDRRGSSRRPGPSEASSPSDRAESAPAPGDVESIGNGLVETASDSNDDVTERSVVLSPPDSQD
jgi:small subunit ribosomal protein S18